MSMRPSNNATSTASPVSMTRDQSNTRQISKSKPSQGHSRSSQSTSKSATTGSTRNNSNTPRRPRSMDYADPQQPQHRPHYNRSQSRNEASSGRSQQVNYTTRRAHFETVSDTASVASWNSPSKTANSDGGSHPAISFPLTSLGTRSTRSDSSTMILRREKINGVKKAIEGTNRYHQTP